MNMNSIPVHLIQAIVTKQSIKTPNRVKKKKKEKKKKNPNNYSDTENAMGYVLIEAQRLVGNWKQFLPTCLGEIIQNVL